MYFLLPFLFGIFYFRYSLLEFILRSTARVQINYNKWLNLKYPCLDYKIFINGKITDKNVDIKTLHANSNKENIFEIQYPFNNKFYSIYGNEIQKLLDYVENINSIIEKEMQKKTPIYKWISAEDTDNVCFLDSIKKSSGPLGDFYKHYNIEMNSNYIANIKGKKITLIDFNLDEYIIEPSSIIKLS
jgi:hypothetical protein